MFVWIFQLFFIGRIAIYECITSFLKFVAPIGYYPRKTVVGQTVILTGAANGIGRQLALRLFRLHINLILWDIDERNLEKTKNLCTQTGAQVFNLVRTMTVDVTNIAAVEEAYAQVIEQFGKVDILINNAGKCTFEQITKISDEKIREQIDLNFTAPIFLTKLVLPEMIARNSGHIVATASSRSLLGKGMMSDYSAEKQGISGFMESLEDEMHMIGKRGIKFTTVCPILTRTNLTRPLGNFVPLLSAESVADSYVDAILCERRVALIPKRQILIYWLKMILPLPVCQMFT